MMNKAMLLVVFAFSLSFAANACDIGVFELSWSNWRILALIGLLVSAAIIAIIYMVGSMLKDESLIMRARAEISQIVITACIIVLFVAIVQFLCGNSLSSLLLGSDTSLYDASADYLKRAQGWTAGAFGETFVLFSFLNFASSMLEAGPAKDIAYREALSESTDLFRTASSVLFSFMVGAWMTMKVQHMFLLFMPPLCLGVFLPLGVVLRSLFPFRRFGGALLGVGIGLMLFVPLLLTINSLVVTSFIKDQVWMESFTCTQDRDCNSKVCNQETKVCGPFLKPGEKCGSSEDVPGDWQCLSGRCGEGICLDPKTLADKGGKCTTTTDCKESLWCNGEVCAEAKKVGDACNGDSECGWRWTNACVDGKCSGTKGLDEACTRDAECSSLVCSGTAPQKKCIAAKIEKQSMLVELATSTLSPAPQNLGLSFGNMITKISFFFSISFIAGFLLPFINLLLLSQAIRDISGFLGAELDVSSIMALL
jgi:hypothetical protein